jgi:glycosyltransferase involved in cell wall biosynthesis
LNLPTMRDRHELWATQEQSRTALAICGDLSFPSGSQIYVLEIIRDLLGAGIKLSLWTPTKPEDSPFGTRGHEIQWFVRPTFFQDGLGVTGKLRRIREEARFLGLVRRMKPENCLVLADRPRLVYLFAQRRTRLAFLLHEVGPSCPGLPPHRFLRKSRTMCVKPPGLGCLAVDQSEGCLGQRLFWRKLQSIVRSTWAVLLVRRLRGVVANSRYTAEMYKQGSSRFDPAIIHPPVTTPDAAVGAQQKDPQARFHIGFIGRVEEEKGIFEALEILARLPEAYGLTAIGEGAARERAHQRAHELGLAARVRFLGWLERDELSKVLREIGVVLLPSIRAEGFVMAGPEALRSGTPVVAYDAGGVGEWCDGSSSRVVGVGDHAGGAAQIIALTAEIGAWRNACRAAAEHAARRFDAVTQRKVLFSALGLTDSQHPGALFA